MTMPPLDIVLLGLTITSSWGNGHASTYRALLKALANRGHHLTFLERDVPWYRANRDFTAASYCAIELYRDFAQLRVEHARRVMRADVVVIGSFLPEGVKVARWVMSTARDVVAFYDLDTPATLTRLEQGDEAYLAADAIAAFDLYLSSAGGPALGQLETTYGARRARPLYGSVDPELYAPRAVESAYDLGYLGTYSPDRQPDLERLLGMPARQLPERRFIIAGSQYPPAVTWPANVERVDHLPPTRYPSFYSSLRFVLNLTPRDPITAGWSPSVRLFEAAACGTPLISDDWPGLASFFTPAKQILIARDPAEVVDWVHHMPVAERIRLAAAARARVLSEHTAEHRAEELEGYLSELGMGAAS